MKNILFYTAILVFATSCVNTKKYRDEMQLFQKGLDSVGSYSFEELKLKVGDNIIINVYTMATPNQEQATVLNLGGTGKSSGTYNINTNGMIDLPKVGLLKAEGLTLRELKSQLMVKWSTYIKDIGINIQLQSMIVNIIGEVRFPGAKSFATEKVTLIDALATSGGFNDDGKRNDVMVIREQLGQRTVYKVDSRDAALYKSPVYQLQQNDLIVVGISDLKFKQRSISDINSKFTVPMIVLSFLNLALGVAILSSTLNR